MSLPGKYVVPGVQDSPPPGDINAVDIKWALEQFNRIMPRYVEARNYYNGAHPLNFATAKFNAAFGHLFQEFADNLCPVIAETVSDRLKIAGFSFGDTTNETAVGFGAPLNPAAGGGTNFAGARAPGASTENQSVTGSQRGADAGGQKDRSGDTAQGQDPYTQAVGPVNVPENDDQKKAREIWSKNRMKQRSGEVHLDALIEGDAFLIVWPDTENTNDGIPYMYPNRASAVTVRYNEERPGVVECAAKLWKRHDKYYRLNLYYTDRLEKYITTKPIQDNEPPEKANAFTRYVVKLPAQAVVYSDQAPAPEASAELFAPWPVTYEFGRVPVFHFPNRGGIGELGTSELKEGIPIQNGLNKSVCDLLVAMEFRAIQQRWIAGLEDEKPGENRAAKFSIQSGGVWAVSNPEAKFGEFSAADLTQFVVVIEMFSKHMARATRTPLHYFTLEGAMPSGESFKTAEAPLIAKIDKRQTAWGGVWEEVIRFALELMEEPKARPLTLWENTEPRNESSMVDNAIKKVNGLGLSATQALQELGYPLSVIVRDRLVKAAERALQAQTIPY